MNSGYTEIKKIAIVGPANVGKSLIFNKFSKAYSVVANYSQTTIEPDSKRATIAGEQWEIIDTPGISSLYITSQDELAARDILVRDKPDVIIFAADAANLGRALLLFRQIQELGIPSVFCLNMIDEAARTGLITDPNKLEKRLGVPVVATAATEGVGLRELENAIGRARPGDTDMKYPQAVDDAVTNLMSLFPSDDAPSKGVLLLFLQDDADIRDYLKSRYGEETLRKAETVRRGMNFKTLAGNVKFILFSLRDAWARQVAGEVTKKIDKPKHGIGQKMAWASRHPVFGIPILIGIMFITFRGVATVATAMSGMMDGYIFSPVTNFVSDLSSPAPFVHDFLVGQYGVLTMGVMNAIGTVVPILIVFFTIINFLEDVGYLPNLSVLGNRMLAPLGLSGKATLTFALGFGCNTMATLTSRMLESKKERLIASFLIALGIPCAVQLGVMIAIFSTSPFSALLIVVGSVIAMQVASGMLLKRLVQTDQTADFIMELPPFRKPVWRNIGQKTYYRVKWFLMEAVPMFVAGAGIMFVMDKTGLLEIVKRLAHPIVTGFLSLPDKVTEVFILVLSRRELGAVYFKDMVDAGELDYYQTVVGLLVMTLFIPCMSNTMVMIKELGPRWAIAMNTAIMILAILAGGAVNYLMRLGM